MSTELLATLYGLASALSFGAGDFSGGFATKKTAVTLVLLFAQAIGAVLLTTLAVLFREPLPGFLVWSLGGAAGICGLIGLSALYTGLSRSKMGIIAPLTGVITTVIPVTVGFFLEGVPSTPRLVGFALALVAVWLLSTDDLGGRVRRGDFFLSLTAGLGFSFFFIIIDQTGNVGAVYWPLVASRLASMGVLVLFLLSRRKLRPPPGETAAAIVFAGLLDSAGNLFFGLASQIGRLDVSTVLSSLYPASTIFLAWLLLDERLNRTQWLGALLALLALILIAL